MRNILVSHIWDQIDRNLLCRDRLLLYFYGTAAILHVVLWGVFVANLHTLYQPDKEFIALHYKVGIGPDFVGPWYYILAIPFLGLAVLAGNMIIGKHTYHHEKFSVYALSSSAACIQGVLIWSLLLIIKANLF
mgnify:FL=1